MGVLEDGDLMFSCECDEPKIGKIIRSVYRLDFTPDNLNSIWLKAKDYRTLMGFEIPTYEQFLHFFLRQNGDRFESKGICARVDDFVGIFWLTDINFSFPPHGASIHYTFFDRRQKGRINLCRRAIIYVFETYGFNRLWTQVPLFTKPTLMFVEEIGFRKEGRIKGNTQYKGQLFDSNLYALTRDEVLNGGAWEDKLRLQTQV